MLEKNGGLDSLKDRPPELAKKIHMVLHMVFALRSIHSALSNSDIVKVGIFTS